MITESDATETLRGLSGFPQLPDTFDGASQLASRDLDLVLSAGERQKQVFLSKLAKLRDASSANLLKLRGTQLLNPNGPNFLKWPSDLYIPGDADYRQYWIVPPPADHRYALAWTTPNTANTASSQTGDLFSFAELDPITNAGQFTDAAIGVFYSPSFTLGVVNLQPHVSCSGTLRWLLQIFPTLAAGSVDVKAQLLLGAWEVIPGGYDLVGWNAFDVASLRGTQSLGPEEDQFTRSFGGTNLSAPFLVQSARTYLLAVIGRISVSSSLTANEAGQTLFPLNNTKLRAWGAMSCAVTQINVETRTVYIP